MCSFGEASSPVLQAESGSLSLFMNCLQLNNDLEVLTQTAQCIGVLIQILGGRPFLAESTSLLAYFSTGGRTHLGNTVVHDTDM